MLLQLHQVLNWANYERDSEHRVSPSFVLQMMKMQEKVPTGAFSPPFRPSPAPASFRRTRRGSGSMGGATSVEVSRFPLTSGHAILY